LVGLSNFELLVKYTGSSAFKTYDIGAYYWAQTVSTKAFLNPVK
jgi:hypothetical protein